MSRRATLRLITAALASNLSGVMAHDWYPVACCSQRDCRHLEEAKGETVRETPEGWQLWDGRLVPRGTAKLSPDNLFHLCEFSDKRIICFFAPPGSS